jgi:hypothetical protein
MTTMLYFRAAVRANRATFEEVPQSMTSMLYFRAAVSRESVRRAAGESERRERRAAGE